MSETDQNQQQSQPQLAPGFTPLDQDHEQAAGQPPAGSPASAAQPPKPLAPGFTPLSPEHDAAAEALPKAPSTVKNQPGLLSKAWDWVVKTPVLDHVLPEGIKTSDLVRGAAFEKMFHEPYIPGVNDFDTKAQQHLGDNPSKAAVKTFIAGTAKDISDFGAGMTTPLGIATIGAGAAAKAAPAIGVLADEAKLLQGAGSAVYAGQGAHDVATAHPNVRYEGITERPETLGFSANPDEAQKAIGGAAGVVGGVAGVHDALPEGAGRWTLDKLNQAVGKTNNFDTAFQRMMKVTPKAAPEAQRLIKTAHDDLVSIINDDKNGELDSPTKIAQKLDEQIQSHHQELLAKAGETQDSKVPVVPDIEQRVRTAVDDFRKANKGRYTEEALDDAAQKIMKEVIQVDHDADGMTTNRQPNLFEADNIRRGFNDRSQTQMGAPKNAYQALANETQKVMRQAIDEGFTERGIPNVPEVRAKDAALIDLRDKLLDAQGKFDAAGQGGLFKTLIQKIGTPSAILALVLGHTVGAPLLATGVLADLVHSNRTNPSVNLNRLGPLAEREPGAATTELEHTIPAPTTPQTPGNGAPPAAPPAPAPTTPPIPKAPAGEAAVPQNHELYSKLATKLGMVLEPDNYQAMDQKFRQYIADPNTPRQPNGALLAPDQELLEQFNDAHSKRLTAVDQAEQKAAEKKQADAEKVAAKAEADKAAQDAKIAAAREAKEAKDEEMRQATAERVATENPGNIHAHMRVMGLDRPVGSHVAEASEAATDPHPDRMPEGVTPQQFHTHEWAHNAVAAMNGIRMGEFLSDQHPRLAGDPNITGGTDQLDKPFLKDPKADEKYTPEEIEDNTEKWLETHLAGAASDELIHGVEFDKNKAIGGDVQDARELLRSAGIDGAEATARIKAAYDHVKEKLETPGVLDTIQVNAAAREANLPGTKHASAARVENFQNGVRGLYEKQNAYVNASEGNGGGSPKPKGKESGVPREANGDVPKAVAKPDAGASKVGGEAQAGGRGAEGKGTGEAKAAGRERDEHYDDAAKLAKSQDGRLTPTQIQRAYKIGYGRASALVDQLREDGVVKAPKIAAMSKMQKDFEPAKPKETSTGDEKLDSAIKEGGGIPAGKMKGDPEIGLPELTLFHEPKSGSTLALPTDKVTPEAVKAHVEAKQAEYAKAESPKANPVGTEASQPVIERRPSGSGFDVTLNHGGERVGHLQIDKGSSPNTAIVKAIDVPEEYQRQGIATRLYEEAKQELLNQGITTLKGSLEGSGPVQIREKVFGPGNTKYFHGGDEVSAAEAQKIMDVDYGYVTAETNLKPGTPHEDFKSWFGNSKMVDETGRPITAYHGTTTPIDFDEFSTEGAPTDDDGNHIVGSSGDPNAYLGAHFAIGDRGAEIASKFAESKEGWMRSRYEGEAPKPRVIPVHLKIENPIEFKSEQDLSNFIYDNGKIDDEYLLRGAMESDGIDPDDAAAEQWYSMYDTSPEFRGNQNQWMVLRGDHGFEGEGSSPAEEAAAELGRQAKERFKTQGYDGIKYKNDVEGGHAVIAFEPDQIKYAIPNKPAVDAAYPKK